MHHTVLGLSGALWVFGSCNYLTQLPTTSSKGEMIVMQHQRWEMGGDASLTQTYKLQVVHYYKIIIGIMHHCIVITDASHGGGGYLRVSNASQLVKQVMHYRLKGII